MNTQNVLSCISGGLFALAYVLLIVDILRKKWQPQKVTFFIWLTINSIMAAIMYSQGTINSVLVVAVIGTLAIALLSLKYGLKGWTKADKLIVYGAALGAVVAWINPGWSLTISCLVLLSATLPTFAHACRKPEEQNFLAWALFLMGSVLGALSLPDRSWAVIAQPATYVVINTLMVSFLWQKPE